MTIKRATVGGLIGVDVRGPRPYLTSSRRTSLQEDGPEPFNNNYVNFSRDGLPTATPITEIAERIAAIAKTAILDNGGRMEILPGEAPPIEGKTFTVPFYKMDSGDGVQ